MILSLHGAQRWPGLTRPGNPAGLRSFHRDRLALLAPTVATVALTIHKRQAGEADADTRKNGHHV